MPFWELKTHLDHELAAIWPHLALEPFSRISQATPHLKRGPFISVHFWQRKHIWYHTSWKATTSQRYPTLKPNNAATQPNINFYQFRGWMLPLMFSEENTYIPDGSRSPNIQNKDITTATQPWDGGRSQMSLFDRRSRVVARTIGGPRTKGA